MTNQREIGVFIGNILCIFSVIRVRFNVVHSHEINMFLRLYDFAINKWFSFYKPNSLIYPLEPEFSSINTVARVTDNRATKDANVSGCR